MALQIHKKGLIKVVKITKEEAMYLREKLPGVCIAIANRQSSHKKYYVEETKRVFGALAKFKGRTSTRRNETSR